MEALLGEGVLAYFAPILGALGLLVFFMSEEPRNRFVAALLAIVGGIGTLYQIWKLHGLPF